MKIALQSLTYAPNIGGVETVVRILAEEFLALGHEVRILTETSAEGSDGRGIAILRKASLRQSAAAVREAHAVLMFGLSLRFLPLPMVLGRPVVVSHHTWYRGRAAGLKRLMSRYTTNIAASRAVAHALEGPATVIPNPYDDQLFARRPDVERTRDLVFVGRLVSDKGLLLLVSALADLANEGYRPNLTVVGSGPDEARCRQAVASSGLERQVTWAGTRSGQALAVLLNGHHVLVVPSVWNEPFGIVALEGAACGCTVVGSSGGGLPEAIGPCGLTFANGDVSALARALRAALESPPASTGAADHLRRHSRRGVAQRYLEVLESALK